MRWFVHILIAVAMFFLGATWTFSHIEPEVITKVQYIPRYVTVTEYVHVPVIETIYPTEFRQFTSQEELSKWQAKHYLEIQELGKRNNWICVDYALELQRRAWLEGYQMSIENLIDEETNMGHAICSTWIGNECIYLEPQSTWSWVGAIRSDA